MTSLLLMLLMAAAATLVAALGVALLDVTIRRAEVGAALIFASAVVQAVFIFAVPSVTVAGGMRIGVTDVAAVTVLAAAVARCLRLHRFSRYQRWVALLGALLLVSLLQGILSVGVRASVNDARQYLFFVAAALYLSTFRPDAARYHRIGRVWLFTAVGMVLLACLRWLAVFAGVDVGIPAERYGVDTATRVLDGPYTFFLAGALVLALPSWLRRGQARWIRWLAVVLLVCVAVLDRRTVWLAVLVGAAVLLLRGRRVGPRTVALLAAASVVTAVAFVADVAVRDEGRPGADAADASTGTMVWRIEGWSDLVTSYSESPVNWIVGRPFGSGFARTVEGSDVQSHPHNFYLETMIRAGIGGLAALVALTFGLLRRLWRIPSAHGDRLFDPAVLPALLAMQLLWNFTWVPGLEQGLITGMCIAVVAAGGRRLRRRATCAGGQPPAGEGAAGQAVVTPVVTPAVTPAEPVRPSPR
jgi:O-antigen ligase